MSEVRTLSMKAPKGPEELVLVRLTADERLGLPYRIEADVLSQDPTLKAKDFLTLSFSASAVVNVMDRDVERHFHGVISEFHRLGPGPGGTMTYRLVVVPGLWRLGLRKNCKIFQDKTIPEIVNEIVQEHGLQSPSWGISPRFDPVPYCTQFNETDLHFVSRLLEEQGLTYYFEHAEGAHKMLISATAQGFPSFSGGEKTARHDSSSADELKGWRRRNSARSGKVKYLDMDDERSQPSVVQQKESTTRTYADEPAPWTEEVFDWPGDMATRPGLDPAAVTMGDLETRSEEFTAETNDPRLSAGVRLTVNVTHDDDAEERDQYVVTAVRHDAADYTGVVAGMQVRLWYRTSLDLVAAGRTFMPALRHERPVMSGLYSAKVTSNGEMIHVDEFGRVKVKFRWDRFGPNDDSSSCWLRVMQPAAGAWGGTWFLPRKDDEVMVAFLDGDPDRPVIVGSVYGKDHAPPFDPGSKKTRTGYKTRSNESGSSEDANILRFDDEAGKEEVLLHAQHNLNVEVENDETREIEKNRTTTIKGGNDTLTLNRGNLSVTCEAGEVKIEAMQKITLKVGKSTIVLDQKGITVHGLMVQQSADTMFKATSSGMMQIKGVLVTIN
jgi:type VI secretion system secreted protein VgrG